MLIFSSKHDQTSNYIIDIHRQQYGPYMAIPNKSLINPTDLPFKKDTEHAVQTATDALNAASAGIEDIPEESRNDAQRLSSKMLGKTCEKTMENNS